MNILKLTKFRDKTYLLLVCQHIHEDREMKNTKKLIDKQYYTVGEVAYILGVTPLTIRNWDKQGKLRAYRNPINNYRIYKAIDIERFLISIEGLKNTSDIV